MQTQRTSVDGSVTLVCSEWCSGANTQLCIIHTRLRTWIHYLAAPFLVKVLEKRNIVCQLFLLAVQQSRVTDIHSEMTTTVCDTAYLIIDLSQFKTMITYLFKKTNSIGKYVQVKRKPPPITNDKHRIPVRKRVLWPNVFSVDIQDMSETRRDDSKEMCSTLVLRAQCPVLQFSHSAPTHPIQIKGCYQAQQIGRAHV